jgi:hypothetical protein
VASAEGNAGAEVLISDSGDMVYVSSRGVGVVVVYRYSVGGDSRLSTGYVVVIVVYR